MSYLSLLRGKPLFENSSNKAYLMNYNCVRLSHPHIPAFHHIGTNHGYIVHSQHSETEMDHKRPYLL